MKINKGVAWHREQPVKIVRSGRNEPWIHEFGPQRRAFVVYFHKPSPPWSRVWMQEVQCPALHTALALDIVELTILHESTRPLVNFHRSLWPTKKSCSLQWGCVLQDNVEKRYWHHKEHFIAPKYLHMCPTRCSIKATNLKSQILSMRFLRILTLAWLKKTASISGMPSCIMKNMLLKNQTILTNVVLYVV